ncbi:MAG: cytochrome c [Roseibacillus sp.]|jgi:mono/diheme cytochrome c family protein
MTAKPTGRSRIGALIIVGALASMGAGAVLVYKLVTNRPVREATVDGLFLRLESVRWLDDQMEHHENFQMPAGMMPDLPPHGVFRLHAEATLFNTTDDSRDFQLRELFLRSSTRGMWPCTGGEVTNTIRLEGQQSFNVSLHFDIAEKELDEKSLLRLQWVRNGVKVQMLDVPHPPDHFHEDPALRGKPRPAPVNWPGDVARLPAGDQNRGKELFTRKYGCVSCHGHPGLEGSNAVGPHLAEIATLAVGRAPNQTAAQYLYQSILNPDATVIESRGQLPDQPSAMPPFRQVLSKREMADLVTYLLTLRDSSPSPARSP